MRKLNSHDLFVASRLLGKVGYKKVLQNVLNDVKGNDNEQEVGLIIVSTILDAVTTNEQFEDAFFEFISSPLEMDVNDLKYMHPTDLLNLLTEFINQEDKETWKSFWSSLAKLMH